MIIYLEGPDGSGKSTLAQDLAHELGHDYKVNASANLRIPTHPKSENRITERRLYSELKKMADSQTMIYIVDRGPISDIVYRVFDNHKPVTTLPKLIEFMRDNLKGIYTIYCCSNKAEENMLKRGDDNPIALTKHKEITKVYNLVIATLQSILKNNIVTYDYSKSKDWINTMLSARNVCYMGMKGGKL